MDQHENENVTSPIEPDTQEEIESSSMKQWLRDNLRIIISVLIVVVIAGGIYSYSNRGTEELAQNADDSSQVLNSINGDQNTQDQNSQNPANDNNGATQKDEAQNSTQTSPKKDTANTSSVATSQETENSFVETAAKGDSHTVLARRALSNYLEKNTDSSLTAEHKIYIEDYLRKHNSNQGRMNIGTSVEFSKSLIQEAIAKSKTLNDGQLKNLHKYAVRVPSLS